MTHTEDIQLVPSFEELLAIQEAEKAANESDADKLKRIFTVMDPEEEKITIDMLDRIDACEVSCLDVFETNQFLFEIDGAPVITLGDIHTIGGIQKGGKTTLMRILISALLGGESFSFIKCMVPDATIVYVDTEMKQIDTQDTAIKALTLAGQPTDKDNERLHMYNFRPLKAEEMKAGIEYLLDKHKPTVMFFDGIVDICSNFNDVEKSQELVADILLKLADKHKCAFICAIHTNKTDRYKNLRGHLGAFLEQKGVTTMQCSMDKQTHIATVATPTHRYKPIEDWHFKIDDNGLPIDAREDYKAYKAMEEEKKKKEKETKQRQTNQEHFRIVADILETLGGNATRKEMEPLFCEKTQKKSTTLKTWITGLLTSDPPMLQDTDGVITIA